MAVRYGRYEVLYKLGQGAMAQVFLAKDPVLSRFVAVKVLHADLASRKDVLQRFFNEARTVAVIRNPHVVEVFDFGQEGRDLYLVMEFVDGLSLHGLLRRGAAATRVAPAEPENWPVPGGEGVPRYEPLDPAVAAALICQAAEGLSIAERHGVVHRDLKPENLMLNSQGYLKISDFGIAHVQDESLTKTGAVLGSPLYMSPEQARGLKPITSQSDMFSLGAVFYACLAGHPPFRGRTVTELFRGISSEPHIPIGRLRPDVDPRLGNLVDTLLQKPPAARGGGPLWLQRQLKAYLSGIGVSDPPELAALHLREVNARGVETTWKQDARNATLPMTLGGTQRATGPFQMRPEAASGMAEQPRAVFTSAPANRDAQASGPNRSMGYLALALGVLGLGIGLLLGGSGVLHKFRGPRTGAPEGTGLASLQATGTGKTETGSVPAGGASPSRGNLQDTVAGAIPSGNEPGRVTGDPSGSGSPDSVASVSSPGAQAIRLTDGKPPAEDRENEVVVILKSSPPFAEAYVDGRYLGMTPVRLDHLVPGRHRLGLKSPKWPGLDTTLVFSPGIHALKVRLDEGPGLRMAAMPVEGE